MVFWNKTLATKVISQKIQFSYLVKYSAGANKDDRLPMLVALHGDGDTVEGFYQSVLAGLKVPARIILIQAPIKHECGNVWPFSAAQYLKYGKAIAEAIDQLLVESPTINKPILFGFSGGGAVAYYQAVKQGDSYSYIFPVSGLLSQEQLGDKSSIVGAGVYAYHGLHDDVVPFLAGKKAAKLLKKYRVDVNFTEFDGGHQSIFSEMKAEIIRAIEDKLKNL